MELRKIIGHNIRIRRELLRMPQKALAYEVGIKQPLLCKIELGNSAVKLECALLMAKMFACTVLDLLQENTDGLSISVTVTVPPKKPVVPPPPDDAEPN